MQCRDSGSDLLFKKANPFKKPTRRTSVTTDTDTAGRRRRYDTYYTIPRYDNDMYTHIRQTTHDYLLSSTHSGHSVKFVGEFPIKGSCRQ